jgi:hypothetical protein
MLAVVTQAFRPLGGAVRLEGRFVTGSALTFFERGSALTVVFGLIAFPFAERFCMRGKPFVVGENDRRFSDGFVTMGGQVRD